MNTTEEQTLSNQNNRKILKFPYHIAKDGVKWLVVVVKVFMDTLCVWPDNQNKVTAFVNFFFITSAACLIASQAMFMLDKDSDTGSVIDAITGIMVSAEAGGRRLLSIILAKRISKILNAIYYDFLPSNIAGKTLHCELKKLSWILLLCSGGQTSTAIAWAFQSAIIPLSLHKFALSTKFWFPYMTSPFYELLYIWESVVCMDIGAVIITFDFFLVMLIWHCVAQFKLLRHYLQMKFEDFVKNSENQSLQAMSVIVMIIQRHVSLINICKELESMLTVFILILYLGTVGTVCLSSFLLTIAKDHIGKAIPYFVGHMIQIFLYCFLGNELILESSALGSAAANSGWHLLPHDKNLRKSLILIIERSQRPITLTMAGFGALSLSSYMKLLQFCFSFYTVLSSTVSRSEQN